MKLGKQHLILLSCFLFFSFSCSNINAQTNLVPNGNFEQYTNCPQGNRYEHPDYWFPPDKGGGGYLNACRINNGLPVVPYTANGIMYAHSGVAYINMNYWNGNQNNYFETKLLDSLKPNKKYYVEYFVGAKNKISKISCNNVALLFTKNAIYADTANGIKIIPANPQIVGYGNPIIKDTTQWTKIAAIYTAQGGEQYATLGNFKDISQTLYIINNPNALYYQSDYVIDDVSVIPLDSFCLKADAGRDTTIKVGDSVFIGSYTNGIDTIKWYNGARQLIDSTRPGFWVKPTSAGTYMYVLQQTVNGCFSKDTVFVNVTTLPLKIMSYELRVMSERHVLNEWTTANEVNVSHYNIERSINAQDFTIMGKVKANDKSSNEYRFEDNVKTEELIDRKTVYYRVVGVDFDGRKTYSTTKQITLKPQTPNNVSVFPNPAKDVVNVECKEAIKGVKVIDCWGREVHKLLVNGPTTYQLVINNNQLAKGVYVVQVTTTTEKVFNEKLVVQ